MTPRRPSPAICAGCLRPHIRLAGPERLRRRAVLLEAVAWADPPIRVYVEHLFDHVTIGRKVSDPAEEGQAHPAPLVPREWTAAELDTATQLAIGAAFGI